MGKKPKAEESYDVHKKMVRAVPKTPERTVVQHPGVPADWLIPSTTTIPDTSEEDQEQLQILTGQR